jgi:hypothetical protein
MEDRVDKLAVLSFIKILLESLKINPIKKTKELEC